MPRLRTRQRGRIWQPLAVATVVAAGGALIALETVWFDRHQQWLPLAAVIFFLAMVAGAVAYRHLLRMSTLQQKRMYELSTRFDLLDNNALGYKMIPSSSLTDIFARIDAAARQARLFRDIAEGVHGVEALFDLDGNLLWISPSIERLTGRSPLGLLGAQDALAILIDDSDLAFCHRTAQKIVEGSGAEDFEIRLVHIDGGVRWVASHWRPVHDENGEISAIRMSAEDIQARKETEYKLLETVAEVRRSDALREHYLSRSNDERMRLSALLNLIRLGIMFIDHDHRVLYYNRAMLDIWGFAANENLIGMRYASLRELVTPVLEKPHAYFERIGAIVASDENSDSEEIRFKDGRIITYVSAVVESGFGQQDTGQQNIGRLWVYEDVTEQRRTAATLVQLAERDPLTNLYNRRRFHSDLEHLLMDAERRRYMVGLIMIDLDGFKPVNDKFGHQAGDEVLVTMTSQVGKLIRRNEAFFRLGGDEFCVLVPGVTEAGLSDLAGRISNGVSSLRFHFHNQEVSLTASLGMAIYPLHALDGEELVAAADHAMYVAKNAGRNRCVMARSTEGEVKLPPLFGKEYNPTED